MRLSAAMIENIRLRVSPEEKCSLRVAATKRGLTLSEYIREVAIEAARPAVAYGAAQGLRRMTFHPGADE